MRGVRNQRSWPGPAGGSAATSMRQIAPFLNSSGRRSPISRAASSPMSGLVTDDGDALTAMLLGQLFDDGVVRCRRAPATPCSTIGGGLRNAAASDLGRLSRPHERARQDHVEGDVERRRAPSLPCAASASPRSSAAASCRRDNSRHARPPHRGGSGTARTCCGLHLFRARADGLRGRARPRRRAPAAAVGRQRRDDLMPHSFTTDDSLVAMLDEIGVQPAAFAVERIGVRRQIVHARPDRGRRFGFAHVLQQHLQVVQLPEPLLVALQQLAPEASRAVHAGVAGDLQRVAELLGRRCARRGGVRARRAARRLRARVARPFARRIRRVASTPRHCASDSLSASVPMLFSRPLPSPLPCSLPVLPVVATRSSFLISFFRSATGALSASSSRSA